MAVAISIDGVSRRFGDVVALDRVSLSIESGEFFTLLGPSGSGKSTLLRHLAGFDMPDRGRILFDGKDMTNVAANHRPSNTVFQDLALFPHMNVAQNVGYGLKVKGLPPLQIRQKVNEALDLVGLTGFSDRNVNKLSGGQRQRAALARSLIMEPGVLLLDEPLTGLDENLRQQMRDEFSRLHERTGATFILVTHNQDEALSLSDRMAVMQSGRIEQVGTPEQFFTQPANAFVARFMGMGCIVKPERLVAGDNTAHAVVGGVSVSVAIPPHGVVPESNAAVLAFRPDQAAIAGPDKARAGTVKLAVTAVRYRGHHFDIHAAFPDGQEIVVAHAARDGAASPVVGETVYIAFSPGAPLLLPDE